MFPASTISRADLYGSVTPTNEKLGGTAAADSQQASGSVGGSESKNPAYFWLSLVGLLVAIRLLWERGK